MTFAAAARVVRPLGQRVTPRLLDLADALEATGAARGVAAHRVAYALGAVSLAVGLYGLVRGVSPLGSLLPMAYGLLVLPVSRALVLALVVRATQPISLAPFTLLGITERGLLVESRLGTSEHTFAAYPTRLVTRRSLVGVRPDGVLGLYVPHHAFGADEAGQAARRALDAAFRGASTAPALAAATAAFDDDGATADEAARPAGLLLTPTPEEWREGLALLGRRSRGPLVAWSLVLTMMAVIVWASSVLGTLLDAWGPFTAAGVVAAALTGVRARSRQRDAAAASRRPFTLHVGDGTLRVAGVTGTFDGPLAALAGRSEGPNVLVLHLASGAGFIVPTRQLPPSVAETLRREVATVAHPS